MVAAMGIGLDLLVAAMDRAFSFLVEFKEIDQVMGVGASYLFEVSPFHFDKIPRVLVKVFQRLDEEKREVENQIAPRQGEFPPIRIDSASPGSYLIVFSSIS